MAAKRVSLEHGTENLFLLYTDTLTEDEDLYRFLVEAAFNIYGVHNDQLLEFAKNVPPLEHNEEMRRQYIINLANEIQTFLPNFIWLIEGRNVWEVFEDKQFIGSSRFDPCSKHLKREVADKYIFENFQANECLIYMGIDWSEEHRFTRAKEKFLPYVVKAPMCDEPYMDKQQTFDYVKAQGIELPRLYTLGFSHNNCGGFCIKAGLGHFINLLEKMPERYAYHEEKEQEFYKTLKRDATGFLRKTTNGTRRYITLKELREMEQKQLTFDELHDFGGCGCFVDTI